MGGISVISGFIGNILSAPFVAKNISKQLENNKK
jgi:hypothetical protein